MTMAKISKWMKSEGDRVEAGEILLEIETDKVNYGIESPVGGVVRAILAEVNEKVAVGGIVAFIGEADEEIDIRLMSEEKEKEPMIPAGIQAKESKEPIFVASQPEGTRVLASPAAKKMAREKGVDLSLVKGTGRSGRIQMADVERYLDEVKPTRIEPIQPMEQEVAEVIPITQMRRTIARRLSQSSHDAPHVNLFTEVDMTETKRLEELLRKRTEEKIGAHPSLIDIFIKIVAVSLRNYPLLNARLNEERIEILKDINIGLAVALDNGLIVPAIKSADEKRIWEIAKERKDLVERARQGHLSLPELERGTFTISNLGMYDIVLFTSILNPPQTGILSIGKVFDRPVVRDGEVVIRPIAEMSLAVDHRVVDGAVGAKFLQDIKNGLEYPPLLF
jgi:pyruvate dehydrogenase E2 component (dihydrolipoamide acetyltransferase)